MYKNPSGWQNLSKKLRGYYPLVTLIPCMWKLYFSKIQLYRFSFSLLLQAFYLSEINGGSQEMFYFQGVECYQLDFQVSCNSCVSLSDFFYCSQVSFMLVPAYLNTQAKSLPNDVSLSTPLQITNYNPNILTGILSVLLITKEKPKFVLQKSLDPKYSVMSFLTKLSYNFYTFSMLICRVKMEAPSFAFLMAVEALRVYLKNFLIQIDGKGELFLKRQVILIGFSIPTPYKLTKCPTISVPLRGRL